MQERKIIRKLNPAPIAVIEQSTPARACDVPVESSMNCPSSYPPGVKGMAVITTDYCLAACAHCFNRSSRNGADFVTVSSILKFIDWWQSHGPHLDFLALSGGEPFHHPDIQSLIRGGSNRGIRVSCTTGAVEVPISQIQDAARNGLSEIRISWDIYHERFISREELKRFAVAASDCIDDVSIGLASPSIEHERRELEWLESVLPPSVSIVLTPVWRVGRASSLSVTESSSHFNMDIPTCAAEFQAVTINHDERIYPCCSLGGFSEQLSLGSLADYMKCESPAALYSRHSIVRSLATKGWGALHPMAISNNKCMSCSGNLTRLS